MNLFFDFILINNKLLISCYHELLTSQACHRKLTTQIKAEFGISADLKSQKLNPIAVSGEDENEVKNKFIKVVSDIKNQFQGAYKTLFIAADLNLGLKSKKPAKFLFDETIREIFFDVKDLEIFCIFSSSTDITVTDTFDFVDKHGLKSSGTGTLIKHKTVETIQKVLGSFPFPIILAPVKSPVPAKSPAEEKQKLVSEVKYESLEAKHKIGTVRCESEEIYTNEVVDAVRGKIKEIHKGVAGLVKDVNKLSIQPNKNNSATLNNRFSSALISIQEREKENDLRL